MTTGLSIREVRTSHTLYNSHPRHPQSASIRLNSEVFLLQKVYLTLFMQ